MMSSVRPYSSGLSWEAFTFGLGRSWKVRHGIVIIPCHCLSAFIPKSLNFPAQGGKRDYGPAPWWKHHGFGHMVFSVCIMPLTVLIINSTSTVSVGKPEWIEPKIKSHTGLISLALLLEKIKFYSGLVYTSSTSWSYWVSINQLNPCFNIKWKSSGWLPII